MKHVHHADIRTSRELLETLAAGEFAWPGGYPLYFLCSDGEALSFAAVAQELSQVARATRDQDRSGWNIVACCVNWEDSDLICSHTGERIPSAYGDD